MVGDYLDVRTGLLPRRRNTVLALAALVVTTIQTLTIASAWNSTTATIKEAIDYQISMWSPTHGLLAGFNPYDPAATEYLHEYGHGFVASLHAPSLLILSAPATLLPFKIGYLVFVVASCLMIWAAVIIVVAPTDRRSLIITVVAGTLLTVTGPSNEMMWLGQVTAFAVLGLALLIRYPKTWVGAIGVALIMTTPQFGVPLSIVFLGLGYWRSIARGWLITLVFSLPALIIAIRASGIVVFVRGVLANLQQANGPANAVNRIDFVGRFASGNAVLALAIFLMTVGVALLLRWRKIELTPTIVLATACWYLLCYFAMPYSIPLVLLAGVAQVASERHWRLLEWLVITLAVLTIPATLVLAAPISHQLRISVGQFWLLFTTAETGMFTVILVVAAWQVITRSRA